MQLIGVASLVMDEITEDLERILLLNLLAFKELSNFGDTLTDVFKLTCLLLELLLYDADPVDSPIQVPLTILRLILVTLRHFHQSSALANDLLICQALLLRLESELLNLLLQVGIDHGLRNV